MSQIFGAFGWLFNTVISRPLGWILGLCYHVLPNYGLALILFTLITRVLLAPLAVKQQKSQAEMVRLQPKIEKLQKKYAHNKEKLNTEMMALYQEEGYNPMGGCLPLLIQMPILFGLFNVIYKPLSYMVGLSQSQISKVVSALWPEIRQIGGSALAKATESTALHNSQIEIFAAHAMHGNMDKLSFLPSNTIRLDFNFLGLDLSTTPHFAWSWMLLIPVVCYLTSLLSTWYSMRMSQQSMPQSSNQAVNPAGMNKSMILIMPLVSAYFATTVPAGVGFYWIITNLFMILQTWGLYKFFNPVRLAAKAQEEADRRREERLATHPELARRQEEEPAEQTVEKTPPKAAGQAAKKPAARTAPRSGKKKSKKQLMEENRRRLAASRAKEEEREQKGNPQ